MPQSAKSARLPRFCGEDGLVAVAMHAIETGQASGHTRPDEWLEDILETGLETALQRDLEAVRRGTDGTYLSVDIDALDGAHAPGTGVPGTAGLTAREMLAIVRRVASRGLVGMDIVEVAPTLDPTNTTTAMAVRIAQDALAFHAGREWVAHRS